MYILFCNQLRKEHLTKEPTSPSQPPVNLGYLLAQSAHVWRTNVARALQPFGLTPPQFFILMSIFRQQSREGRLPTQKDAAAHTAMDLNVASQVTRKLVARKLVARSNHPADGRAYVLTLTPAGQGLATRASAAVRGCNETFFGGTDQAALAKALQKLIRSNDD